METVGLALLGYALLHEWRMRGTERGAEGGAEGSKVPLQIVWVVMATAGVMALLYTSGMLGDRAYLLMSWMTLGLRVCLLSFLIFTLRARTEEPEIAGLLVFPSLTVTIGFSAWLVALSLGDVLRNPAF